MLSFISTASDHFVIACDSNITIISRTIISRNSVLYQTFLDSLRMYLAVHTVMATLWVWLYQRATVKDVTLSDRYFLFFEMSTPLEIKPRHVLSKKYFINDTKMRSVPCI